MQITQFYKTLTSAQSSINAVINPILENQGLSIGDWRVLDVLYNKDDATTKQIAAQTGMLTPSVSRVTTRLFDLGWIVDTSTARDDARYRRFELTESGRHKYEKVAPQIEKFFKQQFAAAKVKSLRRALEGFANV